MLSPLAMNAPGTAERPALSLVEPLARRGSYDLSGVAPRLLRCFLVVAEELHFGRAADRLFVAQPALSRSIQQLERTLERRLFIRSTRSVELTPSGQLLLTPAREVLEAMDALAGDLRGFDATLRVAHPASSDITALILDQLSLIDGAPDVEESTMSGSEQLVALGEGRLDVAVCRTPATLPPELRSEQVRLDPLLIAVIERDPRLDRPVDPRRRSVAATGGVHEDPDYAEFVSTYERRLGCSLRRVAVPAGSGTEAFAMRRSGAKAFVTLESRGVRLDCRCPVAPVVPVQAYFPWSLVWRPAQRSAAVRDFLDAARIVAARRGWLDLTRLPGEPWSGEPTATESAGCA